MNIKLRQFYILTLSGSTQIERSHIENRERNKMAAICVLSFFIRIVQNLWRIFKYEHSEILKFNKTLNEFYCK